MSCAAVRARAGLAWAKARSLVEHPTTGACGIRGARPDGFLRRHRVGARDAPPSEEPLRPAVAKNTGKLLHDAITIELRPK
jgi:hypothetical protein